MLRDDSRSERGGPEYGDEPEYVRSYIKILRKKTDDVEEEYGE
jgi:hypothetical protein